jgi:hypothetical protein
MDAFAFASQALSVGISPSTWRGVSGETPAGAEVAVHLDVVHGLLAAGRYEPTFGVDLMAAFRAACATGWGNEDTQSVARDLMEQLLRLQLRDWADVGAWAEKPGRTFDDVLGLVSAAADLARTYGPVKAVTT